MPAEAGFENRASIKHVVFRVGLSPYKGIHHIRQVAPCTVNGKRCDWLDFRRHSSSGVSHSLRFWGDLNYGG